MISNSPASVSEDLELTNGFIPTTPSIGGSLVVLDPHAPSATLRAALQHPDLSHGRLSLLVVFPTAEYEARRRARLEADVTAPYTIEHLEMEARRIALRVGREWIDPTGVEFDSLGAVGRIRDSVRRVLEDREYTHVYVGRSPRTFWQRLRRVEDRSTMLTRVLPKIVTVVPVEYAFDSVSNAGDEEAFVDLAVDLDPLVEK